MTRMKQCEVVLKINTETLEKGQKSSELDVELKQLETQFQFDQ